MNTSANTPHISRALLVAGLFLALSLALRLATPEYVDPGLARRLLGIMMGAIVVIYANAVPKTLTPLVALRCNPATEQSIRRFTGISLVLGGTGYALAWMLAPMDSANLLSGVLLGVAVLAAGVRYLALFARRPQH